MKQITISSMTRHIETTQKISERRIRRFAVADRHYSCALQLLGVLWIVQSMLADAFSHSHHPPLKTRIFYLHGIEKQRGSCRWPCMFAALQMSVFPDEASDETTDNFDKNKKNSGLKRLAELSLQDYQWRSNIWKSKQADLEIERSLNRMMGRDEQASYLRPMDASSSTIGPLGMWEKTSVEWLADVIEEEARRAKEIVRLGGTLVRPMDSSTSQEHLGPLGQLERRLVNFFNAIRMSEQERSRSGIKRPKDMDEDKRGPLGEAELRAVQAIRQVIQSEQIRAKRQNSNPDRTIVRPIDVPGPLGDFEMAILNVVKAEEQRKQQYQEQLEREQAEFALESDMGPIRTNSTDPNVLQKMRPIRPMNANNPGPLGELEQQATDFVKRLTNEERQRLQNIQQYLDDNRPMNLKSSNDRPSTPLGVIETVVVGIVRAPILLYQIIKRVQTLLESEPLDDVDAEILRQGQSKIQERRSGGGRLSDEDDNRRKQQ
jgi:hypothetical protein